MTTSSSFRDRAHRLYEANTHIFEDEHDAFVALGAEPLVLGPSPPPDASTPGSAAAPA